MRRSFAEPPFPIALLKILISDFVRYSVSCPIIPFISSSVKLTFFLKLSKSEGISDFLGRSYLTSVLFSVIISFREPIHGARLGQLEPYGESPRMGFLCKKGVNEFIFCY